MPVITVNDDNFKSEVLDSQEPVLVDFFAPWCAPCRLAEPVLKELAQEKPEIKVVKVNVDENQATAQQYQVMSIPTVILFKNGKVINQMVGFAGKAGYLKLLSSLDDQK